MEEKHNVNAAVQTKFGTRAIRGRAAMMGRRWVSVMSNDFILPGTEVETLLFLKEPERISGEVRWTLAEPLDDKMVYRIGICLAPDEPVA